MKKRLFLLLSLFVLIFSSACNIIKAFKPSPTPEPTATSTKTPTPTVTFTPSPTSTPTEIPTPTPTLGPPPITSENFLDHLDEIQQHIFGFFEVDDIEPLEVVFITEEEYLEVFQTPEETIDMYDLAYNSIILDLFNLTSPAYDYGNFLLYKAMTDPIFYGGTLTDYAENRVKLVEDYEDPEMQLVNFILRVETYVFLDHCRKHDNFSAFNSKDDITNLKNVKNAIGLGTTYYTIQKWFNEYGDPEAEIPEGFLRQYTLLPGVVPLFIRARESIPVEYGIPFVEHIDKTYGLKKMLDIAIDMPMFSSTVAHPERYPNEITTNIELAPLASALSDDWEIVDYDIMGEMFLVHFLENVLQQGVATDPETARQIGASWGMDFLILFANNANDEIFLSYTIMLTDAEQYEVLGEELDAIISAMVNTGTPAVLNKEKNYTYNILIAFKEEVLQEAIEAYGEFMGN